MARWWQNICVLALCCVPVLLVGTAGVLEIPHAGHCHHPTSAHHAHVTTHHTGHSDTHPGHDAAIAEFPSGHDHCCLCENCHDRLTDALWIIVPQTERMVSPALPAADTFTYSDPLAGGMQRCRPPPAPAPPHLLPLRTVVLLT